MGRWAREQAASYVRQCRQNLKPAPVDQKFLPGDVVFVRREGMSPGMWHFKSGFYGVVEYSYSQCFGNGEPKDDGNQHEYSLIVLDGSGTPVNSISWYNEGCLEKVEGKYNGPEIQGIWATIEDKLQ